MDKQVGKKALVCVTKHDAPLFLKTNCVINTLKHPSLPSLSPSLSFPLHTNRNANIVTHVSYWTFTSLLNTLLLTLSLEYGFTSNGTSFLSAPLYLALLVS